MKLDRAGRTAQWLERLLCKHVSWHSEAQELGQYWGEVLTPVSFQPQKAKAGAQGKLASRLVKLASSGFD